MPLHHIPHHGNFIRMLENPSSSRSEEVRSKISASICSVGSSVRVPTTGLSSKFQQHQQAQPDEAQRQPPDGKTDEPTLPTAEEVLPASVEDASHAQRPNIVEILGDYLRNEARQDDTFKQDLDNDERRIALLRTKARIVLHSDGYESDDLHVSAWCATVEWLSRNLVVTNSPPSLYESTREEIRRLLTPYAQAAASLNEEVDIVLNFVNAYERATGVKLPTIKITQV